MLTRRRRRTWPNVYSRLHRSGEKGFVVDLGLIDGKRTRYSFTSKVEADAFAEAKRIERQNEGTAALALPLEVRQDAAKAYALLAPSGVSLLQAAEYYRQHVLAFREAPLIEEIVKRLLEDAKRNDRRERTIAELKFRLEAFRDDFEGRRLSDITVDELKEWVDDDEWSPRTRINYLTKVSQLFNYALRHGWADSNIADRVERPTAEDKEPGIFTLDQVAQLLEHAPRFHLLPYFAIGLFAGLRSAELMRLDWSAVHLEGGSIVVGAQVAKKRSRRVVEISPVLKAWLAPVVKKSGPIVEEATFRENLDALRKEVGMQEWPHNGLRHSFASYHLGAFGDALKTATLLGHKDPGVVHNHYKALVQKSEAARFWDLRPGNRQENRGT